MLQILCEDPHYRVTNLDGRGYCELNPTYLYLGRDTQDWMCPRVEVLKSLKQHLAWSPVFHWHGKQFSAIPTILDLDLALRCCKVYASTLKTLFRVIELLPG